METISCPFRTLSFLFPVCRVFQSNISAKNLHKTNNRSQQKRNLEIFFLEFFLNSSPQRKRRSNNMIEVPG